jgi:hypothetical protein
LGADPLSGVWRNSLSRRLRQQPRAQRLHGGVMRIHLPHGKPLRELRTGGAQHFLRLALLDDVAPVFDRLAT